MLTLTPHALAIVRKVTAHPRLKPTSGLRIARHEEPDKPLQVKAVPEPVPGDSVQVHSGGRLFLGPGTEARVEGAELDADTDAEGRVTFILRQR